MLGALKVKAQVPSKGLWAVGVALIALLLCLNIWWIHFPAARTDFWFRDGGFTLNTVEHLLKGWHLYADLLYQYGSIPIEIYALISRVFTNSIASFSYYLLAIHILCLVLVFLLLQMGKCDWTSVVLAVLAICSFCALPLGLEYSFEQLLILSVMVLWQAAPSRSLPRGLALGVLLGLMQFIRFGSAVGPTVGLVVADLLSIYALQPSFSRKAIRTFLLADGSALVGFALVEICLLLQLFLTLPADVAKSVAWPAYMLKSFEAYAPVDRYPHWISFHYFVGYQMAIIAAGISVMLFLATQLLSSGARCEAVSRAQTEYRFLIAGVAYMTNAAFFYQQVWHYYGGAWLLGIAAAYYTPSRRNSWRILLVLLFLPGVFVTLRPLLLDRAASPNVAEVRTPNGEHLWLPSRTIVESDDLVEALRKFESSNPLRGAANTGVVFLFRGPITVASHFHFFYQVPQSIRATMIFPGWLQQRDFNQIESAVVHGHPVVLLQNPEQGRPPQDVCEWRAYEFPKPVCRRLSDLLLSPLPVDGASWIFPSRMAQTSRN